MRISGGEVRTEDFPPVDPRGGSIETYSDEQAFLNEMRTWLARDRASVTQIFTQRRSKIVRSAPLCSRRWAWIMDKNIGQPRFEPLNYRKFTACIPKKPQTIERRIGGEAGPGSRLTSIVHPFFFPRPNRSFALHFEAIYKRGLPAYQASEMSVDLITRSERMSKYASDA